MSKPSLKPVSGKTMKNMLAKLQEAQDYAQTFRLRPLAARTRFICRNWNRPETLFHMQVR